MMERIGSIGRKHHRIRISFPLKILCLFLALLLAFFLLNHRAHRALTLLGENELSLYFSSAVIRTLGNELEARRTEYRDVITLTFKENGDVASLTTNMTTLLSLQTTVCDNIFDTYRSAAPLTISLPVTVLFGLDFLSAVKPTLKIGVTPTRFLHTYYTSEFTEAGINQTRHRIVFNVEGSFDLLLPAGIERIYVKECYCVAETVIVGKVPDAYTEIDRLTDDIVEGEIDDIYDFGASTN